MARRQNEKLAAHYFDPYQVETRIEHVAYRLRLPATSVIHPVFHVSQLRRAIGDHDVSPTLSPTLTEDIEVLLEPLEVREVRQVLGRLREVLIYWAGLPDCDATWEDYDVVQAQYPDFYLEYKVALLGGIDVGAPSAAPSSGDGAHGSGGVITYARRRRRGSTV